MVKKEREYPLRLKPYEALLRNLRPDYEKRAEIRGNIRKKKAGFRAIITMNILNLAYLPINSKR